MNHCPLFALGYPAHSVGSFYARSFPLAPIELKFILLSVCSDPSASKRHFPVDLPLPTQEDRQLSPSHSQAQQLYLVTFAALSSNGYVHLGEKSSCPQILSYVTTQLSLSYSDYNLMVRLSAWHLPDAQ